MTRLHVKPLYVLLSLVLALGMLPAPALAESTGGAMGSESELSAEPSDSASRQTPATAPQSETGEMPTDLKPGSGSNDALDSAPAQDASSDGDGVQGVDDAANSESRSSYGCIPIPSVKSIHDEGETPGIAVQRSLPSSYSSVAHGYVTPPKDQGPHGVCWAFSSISLAETSALKQNLLPGESNSTLDLSERHLIYNTFNIAPDPLGNVGDEKRLVDPTRIDSSAFAEYRSYLNVGGNPWIAGIALANWTGAAYESQAPYDVLASRYRSYKSSGLTYDDFLRSVDLGHDNAYDDVVRLKDFRCIPTTDVDDIKAEIMDRGAVALCYFHNARYMNKTSSGVYYYNYENDNYNHYVAIVGWDDSISRTMFASGPHGYPQQDGAWLCKNSWGTDSLSTDGGYYWISYSDVAMLDRTNTCVSYAMEPVSAEDNQYHYDGSVYKESYVSPGGSIASVFEAKACRSGEQLDAVSFYLDDVNVDYSVQIYMDPDEGNPASGTAMLPNPMQGRTTYVGFYKLDLPQGVRLYPSARYSVVVTLSKVNASQIWYGACGSSDYPYLVVADTRLGETYAMESAGGEWEDLADFEFSACLRAYSKNADYQSDMDLERATITASDRPYTGGDVTPQYKVVLDGHVLREGVDYTVFDPFDLASVGKKSAWIQGAGAYSGWGLATFYVVKSFPDVLEGAWYHDVVGHANALGLLNGYKNGNFGPNDSITRGQVAVVLWNMAGGPDAGSGARDFPDVRPNDYFRDAVRWAFSKGVVNGYGNGNFGPNDNVTREQLAVMLANYSEKVAERPAPGSKESFALMGDKDRVSSWAVPAVGWCFQNKILSGAGGSVNPQGNATRAETAKMVVVLHDLLA